MKAMNYFSFCFLMIALILSCKDDAPNESLIGGSSILSEIPHDMVLESDSIEIQALIDYGRSIIPYIVKSREYGSGISIGLDQLADDYSKLETLWNAYQLIQNSETLEAITDLVIGITKAIDQYIARNIKQITDATVLDHVIAWYEIRLNEGPTTDSLLSKLAELRTRKRNIEDIDQDEDGFLYLYKCGEILLYNDTVPKKAKFSGIRKYYQRVDDLEFARELGRRSISDFTKYLQYNLEVDTFITSDELKLVREYAYNLICCRSCKHEDRFETMDEVLDCFESFNGKFERMEDDAKEIVVAKRIKM